MEDLSRQSLVKLTDWLDRRLGFALFDAETDRDRAGRITSLRNVIVHNRGVVNRTFSHRVPGYEAQVGDVILLSVDDAFDDVAFLAQLVSRFDIRAAAKFSLVTQATTGPEFGLPGPGPTQE